MSHRPELTFEQCNTQVRLGAVYVNNSRVQDPATILAQGELVRHHYRPRRFDHALPAPENTHWVEFAEQFVFFWKPHGLPSHPTLDNAEENAKRFCEQKLKVSKLWSLNRLDQGTAGWLAFAKSQKSAKLFFSWSEQQLLTKHYQALTATAANDVKDDSYPAVIENYQLATKTAPKQLYSSTSLHSQTSLDSPAIPWAQSEQCLAPPTARCLKMTTQVNLRETLGSGHHLWSLQLITGRTHQLRLQLSALGAPIVGDQLYGSQEIFSNHGGFALECHTLVVHPLGFMLGRPRQEPTLIQRYEQKR